MSTIYGPVPSRRLGQSLGIDPIPFKTCTYNCAYCQLGRTTDFTARRQDFFPPERILSETRAALFAHTPQQIDWITFVGQGEPLLCASLGWLIRKTKSLTDIPVAVVTNGSLFFRSDVRQELCAADAVLPSLDAADDRTFHRINRPMAGIEVSDVIDGMAAFRDVYQGRLWVEVMLVRGINDSEEALEHIAAALSRIGPDKVHIDAPIRPPAEQWVQPPDGEGLKRAISILGEVAPILSPAQGAFALAEDRSLIDAVVDVIRRHPLPERELLEKLQQLAPDRVEEVLSGLAASGEARRHLYRGNAFWEYAGSQFAAS